VLIPVCNSIPVIFGEEVQESFQLSFLPKELLLMQSWVELNTHTHTHTHAHTHTHVQPHFYLRVLCGRKNTACASAAELFSDCFVLLYKVVFISALRSRDNHASSPPGAAARANRA